MWPVVVRELRRHASAMTAVAWAAAVALWRVWKPVLRALAHVLLALIVVFEEWGWQPLSAALGRLRRFKVWAAFETWLAGLSPYGAMAAFALPVTLLFPLKLVAVWLFANGKYILGTLLLIGAKLTSTAIVARIFILTKPALMQIGWFAKAYAIFVPWEEAAMHRLRSSWAWRVGRVVKYRAGRMARALWMAMLPRLEMVLFGLGQRWGATWPGLLNKARRAALATRARAGAALRRLLGQVSL